MSKEIERSEMANVLEPSQRRGSTSKSAQPPAPTLHSARHRRTSSPPPDIAGDKLATKRRRTSNSGQAKPRRASATSIVQQTLEPPPSIETHNDSQDPSANTQDEEDSTPNTDLPPVGGTAETGQMVASDEEGEEIGEGDDVAIIGTSELQPERKAKRGKYRPRKSISWLEHFHGQNPDITDDGSSSSHRLGTKSFLGTKRGGSTTLSRSSTPAPIAEDTVMEAIIETATEDVDDDLAESSTARPDQHLVLANPQSIREDKGDHLRSVWVIDPPVMEFPFLQFAFPYDKYETPSNRVLTSFAGSLPQPLPQDWYRPQGPIVREDLFSKEKFSYSTEMLRKIPVNSAGLRMDVYYYRGFELATRRMLDRVRSQNREIENSKAVQSVEAGATKESIMPIMDPPRVYIETPWPVGPGSVQHSTQQPTQAQTPTLLPSISTRSTSSSCPEEILVSMRGSAPNLAANSSASASISESIPASPISRRSSSDIATSVTPIGAPKPIASTPTVDSASIGVNTGKISTDSLSSSPASPPKRRREFLKTPEITAAQCLDKQQRMAPTTVPTMTDYYQVNAYLSSLFKPSVTNRPVPLSPAACRILQTLMTGLENKVIGMGCHLQRKELTQRLADVDKRRKSLAVQMNKKPQAFNMDNYVSASNFDVSDDVENEERSFISNPLQIPEDMDPFSMARDYLQKLQQ
ncbi:hypothetical protein BGZ58_009576 [Dissophora ornata]|nr:hypothetical protein BGZ58_009576 [Dissophora ornata]